MIMAERGEDMDERMDSLEAIRKMAPEVVTKMGDTLGSPKADRPLVPGARREKTLNTK